MKFAYSSLMCPPEQYLPLCQAAERLGFDGFTLPDSICYPREASNIYPYNSDGSREFLEQVPFVEPFVLIPFLAGQTETIRFSTSVMKLAVRQPVMVAKQLSSMAALIGDRFDFGVGISPWPEDFEVCQIPWEKRGKRMDEMIQIVRGLLSGEYFSFNGEIFDVPAIQLTPVPDFKVPIIVGGHAPPALRRAARYGDGWVAAGGIDDYSEFVDKITAMRREFGRDHLPFEIFGAAREAFSLDGLKKLQDAGVTQVTVGFRDVYGREPDNLSVEQKIAQMEAYSKAFIEPFQA